MSSPAEALGRAVRAAGSQAALARALNVSPMAVTQWLRRGVSAERARQIEDAVGGAVRRHELRPDLFDAPASQTPHPEEAQA